MNTRPDIDAVGLLKLRRVQPFVAADRRREYETTDGRYRVRAHGGARSWEGPQRWIGYEVATGSTVTEPGTLTLVRRVLTRLYQPDHVSLSESDAPHAR